jgi:hypothetical protein
MVVFPMQPVRVPLGEPVSVTVTAQDWFGNTATGYTGTVHFTGTDLIATLPADYTFISSFPFEGGDNGVHTFQVTFETSGNQTVTLTGTDVECVVTVNVT